MPSLSVARIATIALLAAIGRTQKHHELQDLVKSANLAFVGKVTRIDNEEDAAHQSAFTRVTFAVERRLFDRTGGKPTDVLELVFAGGRFGDKEIRFSGVPQFTVGDEVVGFVLHDGTRYTSPIVGGSAGLLRIVNDPVQGTRYPLLPGGRGLAEVVKGSFVAADRVAAIRAGVVQWAEPEPERGPPRTGAPVPVAGSGAVSATAVQPAAPRPTRLLDLDDTCRGIQACDAMIPAAAKAGGRS